jgi:predicted RNA-binding protein with PUA-like domain
MNRWLFKQEPDEYCYDDLVRDGTCHWDGVTNALAQKHLRGCAVGDQVFLYHTGDQKAIVGVMKVTAGPTPVEPDSKMVIVTVAPVRKFKNSVPLSVIKTDDRFAAWELVRIGRLSVMPVPEDTWRAIEELSR